MTPVTARKEVINVRNVEDAAWYASDQTSPSNPYRTQENSRLVAEHALDKVVQYSKALVPPELNTALESLDTITVLILQGVMKFSALKRTGSTNRIRNQAEQIINFGKVTSN